MKYLLLLACLLLPCVAGAGTSSTLAGEDITVTKVDCLVLMEQAMKAMHPFLLLSFPYDGSFDSWQVQMNTETIDTTDPYAYRFRIWHDDISKFRPGYEGEAIDSKVGRAITYWSAAKAQCWVGQ